MKIRRLQPDDLEQVAALFDAYRQFYHQPADLAGAKAFLSDRMHNQQAILFGAEEEDKMYGFVLIYPMFSSVRMRSIYLLNDLYVLPEARNKQLGKALLHQCQQLAKDNNQAGILLETDKVNQVGNYLYPSVGFEQIIHANFYFWENK